MSRKPENPRFAWALTGSGHYLKECLDIALSMGETDFFLSAAAREVLLMYDMESRLRDQGVRIFRDNTASAPPVGLFYRGDYHTLIVAPYDFPNQIITFSL